MGIETTGNIIKIFDTVKVSEKFSKREFVVEIADNPKYPQPVMFQLTGDRVTQLDDFRPGDKIKIDFSLRGRKWTSPKGEERYFNSLDAWEITHDAPPQRDRGGRRRDDDRDPEWVRDGGAGSRPRGGSDDERY